MRRSSQAAGPPAFLDPELRRLNEWPCSAVFPRANEIAAHLGGKARVCVLLPGEALALYPGGIADAARLAGCENAWTIRDYQVEIETQSLRHADVFRDRPDSRAFVPDQLLDRLELLVRAKLEALDVPETVLPSTRIYIGLDSHPDYLRVDLRRRTIGRSPPPAGDETYYRLTVPAWVVAQLVDGAKWEEMMLSMRVSIARRPDIYDLAIHGFLINEPEGMEQFAKTLQCAERASSERIVVGGYEIDRNCPHMGTDLSDARIDGGCLICPRHGWRFDLRRGGQGIGNPGTINARKSI